LLFTGLNPAHRTLGFHLDNQPNSKFHETLGHENTLDIVSNEGPKVYSRLIFFEAIPVSQCVWLGKGHPGASPLAAQSPSLPASCEWQKLQFLAALVSLAPQSWRLTIH